MTLMGSCWYNYSLTLGKLPIMFRLLYQYYGGSHDDSSWSLQWTAGAICSNLHH
jgi:uncharacterized membrane protein YkvA (DUF1232 family)